MIPVRRVPEPNQFDAKARKPGNAWLSANSNAKRPHDFWSSFLPELRGGFDDLCAYAAMLDPTGGTVDHYLSFKNRPDLAYEWSNYRFASQVLNASKKTVDDAVLDPYEIRPGWFRILLPSLQLELTDKVPPRLRPKALYTITRLKLRDGEKIVRWRRQWYELYERGDLTLDGLRRVAPLLAAAVEANRSTNSRARSKRKRRRGAQQR